VTAPADVRQVPESWRRAYPWLPALIVPRRLYVGPGGEILRCSDAGRLEMVIQGAMPFHRSIASDPGAARGRGR
jgi:hypothetical protein